MNPLDLLKVNFRVSKRGPTGGVGRGIRRVLRDKYAGEGRPGLYRSLVASNASSWALSPLYLFCSFCFLCRSPESELANMQLRSA